MKYIFHILAGILVTTVASAQSPCLNQQWNFCDTVWYQPDAVPGYVITAGNDDGRFDWTPVDTTLVLRDGQFIYFLPPDSTERNSIGTVRNGVIDTLGLRRWVLQKRGASSWMTGAWHDL